MGVKPRYLADLQERLLQAMDADLPAAGVVRTFRISARTLRRWRPRQRERGSLADSAHAGRRRAIRSKQWSLLRAQVPADPEPTLAAHCARWRDAAGGRVRTATMSRLLAKLGLPLRQRHPHLA